MTTQAASIGRSPTQNGASTRQTLLAVLMFLSFVTPFFLFLGSLRLGIYRVFFLLVALPMALQFMSGRAGRMQFVDYAVIVLSFWMVVALFSNHAVSEQWEFAGILVVETLVPFLFARVLIRDLKSFQTFVFWYFVTIACLVPFALYENMTGRPILMDAFRGILSVYADNKQDPRLGLFRAQVTMPHPILYGVFCAPAFALSWYVLSRRKSLMTRLSKPFVVGVAVFSSLSSGAFLGVLLQGALMTWDVVFRRYAKRWIALSALTFAIYVPLELMSNRNVFQIVASELTFSAGNSYNRILIFNNAIDDIGRNPFLGIGLNDWTRPDWMKPSVDNFWLLVALRYGIPAWVMLTSIMLWIFYRAIRAPLTGDTSEARTGYIACVFAVALSAYTVHLWDATYCLFMFLLGAGVWFGDAKSDEDAQASEVATETKRRHVYSRFAAEKALEEPPVEDEPAKASGNPYSRFEPKPR